MAPRPPRRGPALLCLLALLSRPAQAAKFQAFARAPESVLYAMRVRLSEDLWRQVLAFALFRYRVTSWCPSSSVVLWRMGGGHRRLAPSARGVRAFPLDDRVVFWEDSLAVIWSAATGATLLELPHGSPLIGARVFPSGDRVVTFGGYAGCRIWCATSGEAVSTLWNSSGVDGLEVFPDGDRILTWGGLNPAKVWDVATGRQLCALPGVALPVVLGRVFPRGDRVITVSDLTIPVVAIWSPASCALTATLDHSPPFSATFFVVDVAVFDGGRKVGTLADNGFGLYHCLTWCARTGAPLRTLVSIVGVGLLPLLGQRLVVWNFAGIFVFDGDRGGSVWRHRSENLSMRVVVSSFGGAVVAACGSRRLALLDARTGEELSALDDDVMGNAEDVGRCTAEVTLGGVLDPEGFGRGLSFDELQRALRSA